MFGKLFGRKERRPELDPLTDLTLDKLQRGFLVDYDLKTWEVATHHRYRFDSIMSDEWELRSGNDSLFLERYEEDEVEWSVSKPMSVARIEENIRKQIIDTEQGPNQITVAGDKFQLDDTGTGYFFEDGQGGGEPFIYWSYEDEQEEHFVSVEQWGETEFEASRGHYVEEYEFSNILPQG